MNGAERVAVMRVILPCLNSCARRRQHNQDCERRQRTTGHWRPPRTSVRLRESTRRHKPRKNTGRGLLLCGRSERLIDRAGLSTKPKPPAVSKGDAVLLALFTREPDDDPMIGDVAGQRLPPQRFGIASIGRTSSLTEVNIVLPSIRDSRSKTRFSTDKLDCLSASKVTKKNESALTLPKKSVPRE
jgi:hypothetical protein